MTHLPVVANLNNPAALPTSHVETVCLLGNRNAKPDTRVKLSVDTEELQRVKNGEKI